VPPPPVPPPPVPLVPPLPPVPASEPPVPDVPTSSGGSAIVFVVITAGDGADEQQRCTETYGVYESKW
jgi:hypothetical protein